jgi:hypothetical protein
MKQRDNDESRGGPRVSLGVAATVILTVGAIGVLTLLFGSSWGRWVWLGSLLTVVAIVAIDRRRGRNG